MDSIWMRSEKLPSFPKLQGDTKTDVLIVGGGMTGILCAYFLQKQGVDYILVEGRTICSGVTKNTTAKITSQHGLIYHKLVKDIGIEKAAMYLKANQDALQKYEELCQNIDCNFEHKPSYVYSLSHPAKLEEEMSEKGLSFRNYEDLLLLGGGSHRTGKKGGNWKELREFARQCYSDAKEVSFWATQDCMSLDRIPYIGRYSKSKENYYVATGFNKWGMTSAIVAAGILTDLIMEKVNPYAEVFNPSRSMLKPQLFVNMGESIMNLLTFTKKRCPHMGCALKWNEVEKSWDCPCHGSRFDEDGGVINNPAIGDLKNL